MRWGIPVLALTASEPLPLWSAARPRSRTSELLPYAAVTVQRRVAPERSLGRFPIVFGRRDVSTIVGDLASEDTVAIKLHRCAHVWLKRGPCWRVQKALDEHGLDYELVKGPNRPSKRDDLERLSGQRFYPVIEFEDGRVYRAESNDMAARIRAGQLLDGARAAGPVAPA